MYFVGWLRNIRKGDQLVIINTLNEILFKEISNSEQFSFDISRIPSGIYFLLINGANSNKFIKLN